MATVTIRTPFDAGIPAVASTAKAAIEYLLYKEQYSIEGDAALIAAIEAALPNARAEREADNKAAAARQKAAFSEYSDATELAYGNICQCLKNWQDNENTPAFIGVEGCYNGLRGNNSKLRAFAVANAPKKLALIAPFLRALEENLPALKTNDCRDGVRAARELCAKLRLWTDLFLQTQK